jgi:hypothetical protein
MFFFDGPVLCQDRPVSDSGRWPIPLAMPYAHPFRLALHTFACSLLPYFACGLSRFLSVSSYGSLSSI